MTIYILLCTHSENARSNYRQYTRSPYRSCDCSRLTHDGDDRQTTAGWVVKYSNSGSEGVARKPAIKERMGGRVLRVPCLLCWPIERICTLLWMTTVEQYIQGRCASVGSRSVQGVQGGSRERVWEEDQGDHDGQHVQNIDWQHVRHLRERARPSCTPSPAPPCV